MTVLRILLLVLCSGAAYGHGINGHVHVTAWAVAELDGPVTTLFDDPEVFDAYLFGAAFPDTGYAVDDGYGEITHWSPFVEAFIQRLQTNYSVPFDEPEARKKIAFIMGVAAHGLQDELFDTLFLPQIEVRDGAGQDEADPGTDAFLHSDGHLEHQPPVYAPIADVQAVLSERHDHEVEASVVSAGMNRVKAFVIDSIGAIAPGLDEMHRPQIPWAAAHYMDPIFAGSLASEIPATAASVEAIWRRLHNRFPASGRVVYRYAGTDATATSETREAPDEWVALVLGVGAYARSVNPNTVRLSGPDGEPVPVEVSSQRWSGSEHATTRLIVLRPTSPLTPAVSYTATLSPEIDFVDGHRPESEWSFTFTAQCRLTAEMDCGESPGATEADAQPNDEAVDAGLTDAMRSQTATATGDGGCAAGGDSRGAPWPLIMALFGSTVLVVRRKQGEPDER